MSLKRKEEEMSSEEKHGKKQIACDVTEQQLAVIAQAAHAEGLTLAAFVRRTTAALRHYCRQCRSKLSEPTDNPRRGFCLRHCFRTFYRSKCVVCEKPFRRKNEQQRTCIDVRCKAELRRFPEAYRWSEGNPPVRCRTALRNPRFNWVKTGP